MEYMEFQDQLKEYCGIEAKIDENSTVQFDLSNPSQLMFIMKLYKRFPNLGKLDLLNPSSEDEGVKKLLVDHVSNKVKILNFGSEQENIELGSYADDIVQLNGSIQERISLKNLSISQESMIKLFSAFQHLIELSFSDWKLDLEEVPDFKKSLHSATLSKLNLDGCGKSLFGNWKENHIHFDNLINGLSQQKGIMDNLEQISIKNWGIDLTNAQEILEKYDMGGIELVDS